MIPEAFKQEIVKKLATKAVRKAALSLPFLLTPGVNTLTIMAAEWIIDNMLDEAEVLAYYAYKEVDVGLTESGVKRAATEYKQNPNDTTKAELIRRARYHASLRP